MRSSRWALSLSQNEQGRNFVVGDVHFNTFDVHKGLKALGFDSTVDRVIAVGDLIDRGPGVLDGLKLLASRGSLRSRAVTSRCASMRTGKTQTLGTALMAPASGSPLLTNRKK